MQNSLYSFLGIMQKSGCISSGNENVNKTIKEGKCKLLILSKDISSDTANKLIKAVDSKNIPFIYFGLKEQLGYCIGKAPRSCLSITNLGFSNSFIKKLTSIKNGGEDIDEN